MTDERMIASTVVDATPQQVFDVLADPTTHAAIDGTGWVRDPIDAELLTAAGQVFRMAMYHENHPDGDYEMANEVDVFVAGSAIGWKPGQYDEAGILGFGGWTWRYDLEPIDAARTKVTLTYDWSNVPPPVRDVIGFPPFGEEHLERSLDHLASLVTS